MKPINLIYICLVLLLAIICFQYYSNKNLKDYIAKLNECNPDISKGDRVCRELILSKTRELEETINTKVQHLDDLIHFQNDETNKMIVESHIKIMSNLKENKPSNLHEIISHNVTEEYEKTNNIFNEPIINDINDKIQNELDNIINNSSSQNKTSVKASLPFVDKSIEKEQSIGNLSNLSDKESIAKSTLSNISLQKYPKINDLKNIAKSRNLAVSGTKKELINRIINDGYVF
jgi:hypothetical protein